jgi:DNA repair exonuclease SbcCD nuclease subunit
MEILVVGDSHLTGRNPIARKDDLIEVQFEKWEYIIELANENDVPIVHTGDIFNVAIIANSLLTRLGEILTKLHNPLYFVWGNHDLQYHSSEMWNRTSLGVLWKNNDKVRHISGFLRDYKINWAWLDWGSDDIQWFGNPPDLLLTHKAIVSGKKLKRGGSWILDDTEFCMNIDTDQQLQKYRLIICGHWHRRYIYKHKGVRVINPGPVTRRTVEEWSIPSVTLLNLDTLIHKELIISDLDPEQVLSRTHIEQNIETMTDNVLKFVDSLKNKKFRHKKSFLKTLMHNLDQHELPNKVEVTIRTTIADLIEKGAINESP